MARGERERKRRKKEKSWGGERKGMCEEGLKAPEMPRQKRSVNLRGSH